MESWQCTWLSSQKLTSQFKPLNKLHRRNLLHKFKQWLNHWGELMRLTL